ncbi:MAG: rhamnulokinase [Actinobacteria bacterium]|nr:rhamnulokinase [Actinomycetota bacterium]
MSVHVAVDLGASSGRVMLARVGPAGDGVRLEEVHRFGNEPVTLWENGSGALHWDVVRLFAEVLSGLRAAGERLRDGERVDSIGIDSWAVDYGLLDGSGALLGTPYCYRDERTARGVEAVHAVVPHADLYARNGLQFLPFNTLYQLAAEDPARLAAARAMLLVPDLLGYWLTGAVRAEATNASTTGLLDVRTGEWDVALAERLGLPAAVLPPLVRPGETVGTLLPHVAEATGLPASTPVVAVGSHDTASAVVAVPATGENFAYVSSGTWSLVGVELAAPVLTDASRAANFTNEGGVDGRVRYLRNVMGLWVLSESLRTWDRQGSPTDLGRILTAAAEVPDGGPVVDVDDPSLLPPGEMPARLEKLCAATGQPFPGDRPAVVRCILDSLAAAYARAVDDAARLSGREVDVVHVVGGGSLNTLLCRLTARATGRPVLAGPVEATALGNALVQARAVGAVTGFLEGLRATLRPEHLARYLP